MSEITMRVEIWQLVVTLGGALGAWVGALWGLGKVLARQWNAGLDARFAGLDKARRDGQEIWARTFAEHVRNEEKQFENLRAFEREFLQFKVDIAQAYVRREDWARNQTVIEAKLDAVALRIDNLKLRDSQ